MSTFFISLIAYVFGLVIGGIWGGMIMNNYHYDHFKRRKLK